MRQAQPPSESATIFVVDDNPVNLQLLFKFLKGSGFKVLIAKNGKAALEKLENTTPDLILLDVAMPEISGFEVCRRLKANPKTQEIPIVFITALTDIENKIYGLTLGAVDFICKPFQHEEILSRVRLHLKLSYLTKSLQEKNIRLSEEISARESAQNQLKQLNQQLERRVQERTQELQQALQKLQVQERQLKYEATHDMLTRLPNRMWLMQQLTRILQSDNHDCHAVFLLDLDRFKKINDCFGHLAGDALLKKVSRRLEQTLKKSGTIARFGGDEFVILLPGIHSIEKLESTAQLLLEKLRHPFLVHNYFVTVGASIGIVASTAEYDDSTALLRDVDVALYRAKSAGKGRYVTLSSEMQSQALELLRIEADLRRAIERAEFCLHYQPIIALDTQQLVGFEALIRWQHPQQGLLFPGKFIAIAEDTGLIHQIDLSALKLAGEQFKQWQEQFNLDPSFTINVNFSTVQLQHLQSLEEFDWNLYLNEFSSSGLKLEITESGFLETTSTGLEILKRIAAKGVRLCIDDFGTGYSSLSRLHTFPVHTLKIDRAFVSRLDSGTEGTAIVQTILALAGNLGMDVVAEGIETIEQLEKLKKLNCNFGQGYLIAKPLDSQKATEFLSNYFPFESEVNYA